MRTEIGDDIKVESFTNELETDYSACFWDTRTIDCQYPTWLSNWKDSITIGDDSFLNIPCSISTVTNVLEMPRNCIQSLGLLQILKLIFVAVVYVIM